MGCVAELAAARLTFCLKGSHNRCSFPDVMFLYVTFSRRNDSSILISFVLIAFRTISEIRGSYDRI